MEENTKKIPIERIGFATLVGLALTPLIVSVLHFPVVELIGGNCSAFCLVCGALGITLCVALLGFFVPKGQEWMSLLMMLGLALVLAFWGGKGFPSQFSFVLLFACLGLFHFLWMPSFIEQLPLEWEGLAQQHRLKTLLFVFLGLFTVYKVAQLGVFMNDARRVEASVLPTEPFLVHHSCLTAYVHAAKLLKDGNTHLYDPANWAHQSEVEYPPFHLDAYMYPPPFLLLTKPLFAWTNSFLAIRAFWFGLCGLFVAFAFWILAKYTSTKGEWHSMLLIFLVASSVVVLITLQVGNVQHVVMAMAVLGMLAFERKMPVVGGALLAFAIAAKISPGLLVVVLLVQGKWKEIGWTAVFGAFFVLLSVMVFGLKPLIDFVTVQLPLLSSGQAMYWLDDSPQQMLINTSPFGIPFKLSLLGVELENPWSLGKLITNVFTLGILVVTVVLGRRTRGLRECVCFWLGVLTLSGLQSPFAPGYISITLLWGMTVIGAEVKGTKGIVLFVCAWILLTLPLLPFLPVGFLVVFSFVQLLVGFVVIGVLIGYRRKAGLEVMG